MTQISRVIIDNSLEEMILIGMIVSKSYLNIIAPLFDPSYFKNSFAKRVALWAFDYWEHYEEAIGQHIQDVFEVERGKIDEAEAEIIAKFLDKLSRQYEVKQEVNEEYLADKTLIYFKKRELDITSVMVKKLVDLDRIEDAEKQLAKYKKIQRIVSGWYNPLVEQQIQNFFAQEKEEGVFKCPGLLGDMIGWFKRGWLISILGPFKRGKTAYMQELAIQALGYNKKVAFISLEMQKDEIGERIYRRISGLGGKEENTYFLYPVFDCELNQKGECKRPERTNRIPLIGEDGRFPSFSPESSYKPCFICKSDSPKQYRFASWFQQIIRPKFNLQNVLKKSQAFGKMYGEDNFRVKIYPRFSATLSDIRRDLDILEHTEQFIPDVLVVDYLGIVRPEKVSFKDYTTIDNLWMEFAGLVGERKCVGITGSQGTRGAIHKTQIEQEDTAGWIGQLAHVDIMLALNQTKIEKGLGQIRIGLLAHRHKKFLEDDQCILLQQLELGQPNVGAYRCRM